MIKKPDFSYNGSLTYRRSPVSVKLLDNNYIQIQHHGGAYSREQYQWSAYFMEEFNDFLKMYDENLLHSHSWDPVLYQFNDEFFTYFVLRFSEFLDNDKPID